MTAMHRWGKVAIVAVPLLLVLSAVRYGEEPGQESDHPIGDAATPPWTPARTATVLPEHASTEPAEPTPTETPPVLPTGTAGKTAPHDAEVEHLMHEFLSTGESIEEQPGGTEPLQFPGPPNKPNWFQALMVTRDENPLLERQCKKQALEFSIESLRLAKGAKSNAEALRAAAEHMKHHQDFIKNNKISYAKYLQEIAECRTFCGPLVANLIKCHVLSVARHTHGIVLFKLDSDAINPRYQAGAISVVARQLQEHSDSKVLLIGRASKIGELTYNRQLAARRTLAVRDSLLAKGISFERIKVMWFGWEPPQISSFVATEYGLEDLFHEAGLQEINQSVTMVLY